MSLLDVLNGVVSVLTIVHVQNEISCQLIKNVPKRSILFGTLTTHANESSICLDG